MLLVRKRYALAALVLALSLAVSAQDEGNTTRTPCGSCCAPGGVCTSAFKGEPGVCCGVLSARPFCCPAAGSSFGAATCYRQGDAFRCRGAPRVPANRAPSTYYDVRRSHSTSSWWWALFALVIPIALLALCAYGCFSAMRRRKDTEMQQQPMSSIAMSPMPAGQGAAYGYPAQGQPGMMQQQPGMYVNPAYGGNQAGGGASPFLAGGAGLLGGYMLGNALGGHGHGSYGYGGGPGYGGGYGGGGGWGGDGGDFAASSDGGGGGGADFAADS